MDEIIIKFDNKATSDIKGYFCGLPIWPQVLMAFGGFLLWVVTMSTVPVLPWIFFLVGIAGVVWAIIRANSKNHHGAEVVDATIKDIIGQVTEMGYGRLNVEREEVSDVAPMAMVGPGSQPYNEFADFREDKDKKVSAFGQLNLASSLNKEATIYRQRVGADYRLRYSLVNVTVFYFAQKQIYAISAQVDLTKGYTYENQVYELFYEDITALNLHTSKRKVLTKTNGCSGKATYMPIAFDTFELRAPGAIIEKTIVRYPGDNTLVQQLNGMRSLVRERKNN